MRRSPAAAPPTVSPGSGPPGAELLEAGQRALHTPVPPGPAASWHRLGGLAAPGASARLGSWAARSWLGDEEERAEPGAAGAAEAGF